MTDKNETWQHIRTLIDGENFELNGINIWNSTWKATGESIHIKDPLYGQDYTFAVYEVRDGEASATFAAGEFSNCVWGIYLKNNLIHAHKI